jgi:predicted O-methyltransferase YrrM
MEGIKMRDNLPLTLDPGGLPGQLWPNERAYLERLVKSVVPTIVLEVGCGCGAGSTYSIAKGLRANRNGELFTCDLDQKRLAQAKKLFEPWPFVKIRDCRSDVLVSWLFDTNRYPQIIFFDGPENPDVALNDLKKMQGRLRYGTHFLMHDWNPEHSTKAIKVRKHVEEHPHWKPIKILTQPDSLGMAHYQFTGNPK